MMAAVGWPPMEPIPEEGEEWPHSATPAGNHHHSHSEGTTSGTARTTRKREVFTCEQVDTLVSVVPKEAIPTDWVIENEVVDPQMATSYLTESLAGPASARGSSYTYTYEPHYDNTAEEEDEVTIPYDDEAGVHQTQRVTRVTKVTTTRSVRQIPVGSPYGDMYFDASGLPTPSPVIEVDAPIDQLGIRLRQETTIDDRAAPPPAPPMGGKYQSREKGVPLAPGAPEVISCGNGEITVRWDEPAQQPDDGPVIGYQIEMREYPDGEWERAHETLLRETSCTLTNLEGCTGAIQLRVSAAGQEGFGPPSAPSHTVYPAETQTQVSGVPLPPGRPTVTAVDGQRATIEWEAPPTDTQGAPLAGYQVEYRVYGTTDWIVATDTWITQNRYTVDSLRPNGVYEFRVRGRNADGMGAPSRSSGPTHIKPAAPTRTTAGGTRPVSERIPVPGQPQIVEYDMDWVKLEWAESSEIGGAYIVEYREVGDPNWYAATTQALPHNCIQVEGLRPGSSYEFRVLYVLDGLFSQPSEVSEIVNLRPLWKGPTGRSVPSRPTAPEYLEIDGDRIMLCWQPAQSTLPVLGYDVEFRDFQQDANWYKVNDSPIHSCKMTVGDLIVDHEYQFRVIAHNASGSSDPSEASPPVTIQPNTNGDVKFVEAERFGAIRLLQEEIVRESPPLPDRDDSPPPLRRGNNYGNLQWRDPNLREVIDYLGNSDKDKQRNASGYLQHLTYSDNLIKEETRELGGIPKLVHLLKSDDAAIQKNACACLKNLCYGKENDRNKLAVLECDGIRMLSALVQTTHDASVKEESTAALWNLSSADPLKIVMLESAADPLVQQVVVPGSGYVPHGVSSGFDQLRNLNSNSALFKNATGVLRNISAANAAARQKLRFSPHLIESLIHFLTTAIQRGQVDSPAVENVVCLLRNLSYRIQEVEDPNYDPSKYHLEASKGRSKSAPSGSPKLKKKEKKKKDKPTAMPQGASLLWQPNLVKLYLKLLQEASNLDTLEASAGAVQNLAACQFQPSADVRATVRVEKGLPVMVELLRLKEDHVVCAVATALRNLSLDQRNRDLIGKYALRDLIDKLPLPEPNQPRQGAVSDQTIGAILGTLFEIVRSSDQFTRDLHEARGTVKLQALAKSYPTYSSRVCKYASQVLYMMWQHKELHDGFRRAGLKEADFYSGNTRRGDSATLARPISSQGRERPAANRTLDDTMSSGYGAIQGATGRSQAPPTGQQEYNSAPNTGRPSRPSSLYNGQYGANGIGNMSVDGGSPESYGMRNSPAGYGSIRAPAYDTLGQNGGGYSSVGYGAFERREPLYASVQKQQQHQRPVDQSWV